MKYFFILGKTSELSVLEIVNLANTSQMKLSNISRIGERVLVLETGDKIDARELIGTLGGVVKFGEVVLEKGDKGERGYRGYKGDSGEELAGFILENVDKKKKVYFGFSVVDGPASLRGCKGVMKLGLEVKKILKDKGVRSRFVTSKEEELSSVVVKKNKLVSEQGVEFVFIQNANLQMGCESTNCESLRTDADIAGSFLVGRTLEVQEFSEFSARDYGRPERDMKVGMIPLKLARMMINIAGADKQAKIVDPFCGGGTILQELLLLGYQDIVGGDISPEMIRQAKVNLDWLDVDKGDSPPSPIRRGSGLRGVSAPSPRLRAGRSLRGDRVRLYCGDARKMTGIIPKNSVDAIVTEPYLGPGLFGKESRGEILEIKKELEKLYLETFFEFRKVLKRGGVVVMVWPVWCDDGVNRVKVNRVNNDGFVFLDILEGVERMGFKPVLGEGAGDLVKLTERGSVVYGRRGQKVMREVVKFGVE